MKLSTSFLCFVLLFLGCSKDPKEVEKENKSKVAIYISMLDDEFNGLEKLFAKVDTFNSKGSNKVEVFNPNSELIVSYAKIMAITTNIVEIPVILDVPNALKTGVAEDFVSYFRGYFTFYLVDTTASGIRIIPREELAELKRMVNWYKTVSIASDTITADTNR